MCLTQRHITVPPHDSFEFILSIYISVRFSQFGFCTASHVSARIMDYLLKRMLMYLIVSSN